jgi:hypothetical protein
MFPAFIVSASAALIGEQRPRLYCTRNTTFHASLIRNGPLKMIDPLQNPIYWLIFVSGLIAIISSHQEHR